MTPAAAGRGSEPRPHQGLDATVLKPIESIGRTLDAAGLTVDEARSGPEARSDTMSHCATTHSHDR